MCLDTSVCYISVCVSISVSACVFLCVSVLCACISVFCIFLSLCACISGSIVLDVMLPFIEDMKSFYTERNLNPKAACLKRREEEKIGEDAPEKRMAMGSLSEGSKRGNRRAPASNSRRG